MFNLFRRSKKTEGKPPEFRPLKQPTITPRNGWIPCEEALPAHDCEVLVLCQMPSGRLALGVGIHRYGLPSGEAGFMKEYFEVKAFAKERGVVVAWQPSPISETSVRTQAVG